MGRVSAPTPYVRACVRGAWCHCSGFRRQPGHTTTQNFLSLFFRRIHLFSLPPLPFPSMRSLLRTLTHTVMEAYFHAVCLRTALHEGSQILFYINDVRSMLIRVYGISKVDTAQILRRVLTCITCSLPHRRRYPLLCVYD